MNEDFPRIITLLRKEKGLSQKQAAAELGISQALLSHYEKGIRECGLDFLVRVAKYYDVSCDYLVGISPHRSGAVLKIEEPAESDNLNRADSELSQNTGYLQQLNKKLLASSLDIIFDLLEKINNKALTSEISSYLMVSVYKMFRVLYSTNHRNPQGMFSISVELQRSLSSAVMLMLETNAEQIAKNIAENKASKTETTISPETIVKEYPKYSAALCSIIQVTEQRIKAVSNAL